MVNHVFIAYSRKDKDFVLRLAACLKREGIPIWLDLWEIHASNKWNRNIAKALSECQCLIVVLSEFSVESHQVESEYLAALQKDKIVVPIVYQNCEMPYQLVPIQHIDFTSRGPDDKNAIDEVKKALAGCRFQEPQISESEESDSKLPSIVTFSRFTICRNFTVPFKRAHRRFLESVSEIIQFRPKIDVYFLGFIMFALLAFMIFPNNNSSPPTDWKNNGTYFFNQGNFDEALLAFDNAIELNPSYTAAWVNKGVTLNRLNRCDEALMAYDKAIEYNSKDPIAWFNKGNTLYMMGNYKESLQAYKNATDIDPNYARSYYGKGCSLYMMEDDYNAVNDYKIAEKYGQNQTDIKMFSDAKDLALKRLNRMDDRDDF
jgi:tetratricopeptide (TPR) repeat protein